MPKPDSRQSGTSSAGATSLSWSHTVGDGLEDALLTVQSCSASASNFAVSGVNWDDGGAGQTALTRLVRQNDSATQAWAEIWYLLSPSPGTKTIKVTYDGSLAACTGSSSWSAVDQQRPFNPLGPVSNTGSAPTQPSVTMFSAVGEHALDAVIDNENTPDTLVLGPGQTTIHNITVGTNMAGASSDEAGAPSVTMSWSGVTTTAPWAIIAASMRPAFPKVRVPMAATQRAG